MQQNKANKFNQEFGSIIENKQELQSKLESVMGLFELKKHLSVFNQINSKTFAMKGSKVRWYWQPQIFIFEEQRAILKILKSSIANNGWHLGIVIEIFMNYSG